jgi:thioredoxin reductase
MGSWYAVCLQKACPSTEESPMSRTTLFEFDVAIVGGGPAGLSAAIVLGRARRKVVVFDHAKPRNFAARAVHGFLGLDGLSPGKIRELGRQEAMSYGVTFIDDEVASIRCLTRAGSRLTAFAVAITAGEHHARSVLLATGMMDHLPEIPGVKEAYGEIVHHCPYCDGWEHRDQALVALGDAAAAPKLGAELLAWSERVTVCTNGEALPKVDRFKLERLGIAYCCELVTRLDGEGRKLHFANGQSTSCEALFFSSEQSERSKLPQMLGCQCDDEGFVVTKDKQCTSIDGVYLAGDADGDVQFAIVAAAEGAIAATAIHQALLEQEQAG